MAVTYTVVLDDAQERLLNWHTAQINALRAHPLNARPPVTDPPGPLTPEEVFFLTLNQLLAVRAAEFEEWKTAKRSEAIAKAGPVIQAEIDAKLQLDLNPRATVAEVPR